MNRLKNKKFRDVLIIAFCLIASFQMINSVLNPYIEVRAENTELKKQIDTLTETNESLQKSLDQSENSTAMEEGYIRERFHMSKKDELIFVFPNDK